MIVCNRLYTVNYTKVWKRAENSQIMLQASVSFRCLLSEADKEPDEISAVLPADRLRRAAAGDHQQGKASFAALLQDDVRAAAAGEHEAAALIPQELLINKL